MVRKPRVDENGIKKGAWSQEEDDKLRAYVLRYGHWNWRQLPKFAGLSRCGKSCRLRWLNYLRKDVKRGNYTKEEEDLIIKLREEHGNKWSLISAKLPGKTDNEIKNYWHSRLRKRQATHISTSCNVESQDNIIVSHDVASEDILQCNVNPDTISLQENNVVDVSSQQTLENYSQSSESSSSELSSDLDYAQYSNHINLFSEESITSFESIGNFWSEPFLLDGLYNPSISSSTSVGKGFVSPYYSYYDDNVEFYEQLFIQEMLEN